jgi:hypothetical protein
VKFTPNKKLRLWIAGDSLVVVPGESVLREVAGNRAIDAADAIDGRIASGLERPDVFNWFTHVREQMDERKPHAVVLMFGGNDDHGFMTGVPEGRDVGTFGSPTWRAEYGGVAAVMDTVTGGGYCLDRLPISHDADQTPRYDDQHDRPGRGHEAHNRVLPIRTSRAMTAATRTWRMRPEAREDAADDGAPERAAGPDR